MTDTSTQAVEAIYVRLKKRHTSSILTGNDFMAEEFKLWADTMIALAAERDELIKAAIMQKAAYDGVSSMLMTVQKDCIAARRTALEDAAQKIEPKTPRPCGCDQCDCGNVDDAVSAAYWDAGTEAAKIIRALIKEEQK